MDIRVSTKEEYIDVRNEDDNVLATISDKETIGENKILCAKKTK